MLRRLLLLCTVLAAATVVLRSSAAAPIQDPLLPPRDVEITISEGTNFMAVASPDRRWIAIDLLGALWVLPIGGGTAKRVTPESIEARHPTWSPDGKVLAFQGFDDQTWHIHTIGVDYTAPGTPIGIGMKALTTGPFDDEEPDWSPDGRTIVFSSDRFGGISSIWQVEVATGLASQLSTFSGRHPCYGLPGDPSPAWRMPVSGREVVFYGTDPGGRPFTPDSSPQWWILGLSSSPQSLAVARVPNPSPTPVFCASGRWVALPQTSPREDVFPFAPQSINPRELDRNRTGLYTADGHIKQGIGPQGGTVIPFVAALTIHVESYRKNHRALQSENPQGLLGIVSPTVSPDGSRVAFTALGDLWVLEIGQKPIRITNDPALEIDPTWSPEGQRLAYAAESRGLQALDLSQSSPVPINLFRGAGRPGASGQAFQALSLDPSLDDVRLTGTGWSSDGREIVYRARDALMIRTVSESGVNAVRRILPPGARVCGATDESRPTWTPRGTVAVGRLLPYIACSRDGTNQLLTYSESQSAHASVLLLHHSAGNRKNGGPVWSPDLGYVAYVTEGRLFSQPVDSDGNPTGNAVVLTDDTPSFPSWQRTVPNIFYVTPSGLRKVPAGGGSSEPIDLGLSWVGFQPSGPAVVHAGALFDGRSSTLYHSMDVIVDRGRIQDIVPHDDQLHRNGVIDASNDTVIPGLIDSQVHMDPMYGAALGRILLSYGITAVRDAGTEAYATLEMRESYDAGRRVGPRVFTAGDPLAGIRVFEPGGASVGSPQQLEKELARARSLTYDFYSTRTRLPDKYLKRATAFAHEQGRPVLSPQLLPAAVFGIDVLAPLRDDARRGVASRVSPGGRTYEDVAQVIGKLGMHVIPGFAAEGAFRLATARDPRWRDDARLSLFPQVYVQSWQTSADSLRRTPDLRLQRSLASMNESVDAVARAGGKILAGSDASASTIPYGLGLHIELEEIAKSRDGAFGALQSATILAAEALGVDDEIGSLERGKLADLVIVEGDPLGDIRAARNVKGVMRGGWYYNLAALGVR